MASINARVEKGVVQGELRRQLSVVNLRASMACLLDRLHQAGEGGRRQRSKANMKGRGRAMMASFSQERRMPAPAITTKPVTTITCILLLSLT